MVLTGVLLLISFLGMSSLGYGMFGIACCSYIGGCAAGGGGGAFASISKMNNEQYLVVHPI